MRRVFFVYVRRKPEELEQNPRQRSQTLRQGKASNLFCAHFPFFTTSDSDMICLSKDNTHVCSCQCGEIIYSIKLQVHADKQTGRMFIYETSRWQEETAGGGLSAPRDPPAAASFTLRFTWFWFNYFQINCSCISANHSLTSKGLKFLLFFCFSFSAKARKAICGRNDKPSRQI